MAGKRSGGPSSDTAGDGVRRPAATTPVAALIVMRDQARRIAATVRGALSIPGVDLVVVVDDGSTDNGRELARKAGAVVIRHSHARGRAAAIETGLGVVGMRDEPNHPAHHLLLLPGAIGQAAAGAAPLVPAVTEAVADLAIAVTGDEPRSSSIAANLGRNAIERASGWAPAHPFSMVRCVTREALESALPLAHGVGLEVGMTLDVILHGFTATEVDCEVPRGAVRRAARGPLSATGQYRDVMTAVSARRIRSSIAATQHATIDRLQRSKEDDE